MKNLILKVCLVSSIFMANFCLGGTPVVQTKNAATKYCGGNDFVATSEALTYARKETTNEYSIKGNVPNYNVHAEASNCANVAGAEVIGYYDRLCENLVPNYKTYIQMGAMLVYRTSSAEISQVIIKLKDYMNTDAGTTFNGFHRGMKTYVEEHSYSYRTEDLGALDFDKYKAAVEANKPVALFLSDYAFYIGAEKKSNGETIKSEYCDVAHVVIGCGYKIDTYYDSNGQILFTRRYLKVASGFDLYGVTYLCLDFKTTIDRATSIIIG